MANLTRTSVFISLILRHKPAAIGITLDDAGWADTGELLAGLANHGHPISLTQLEKIVAEDSKQRYMFSDDKKKIRANQGHSIDVNLGLEPKTPPDILLHGSAGDRIGSILKDGLKAMSRQYVHLSVDETTATTVGGRHGVPAILYVRAKEMHEDGYNFFCSQNGVWLTKAVPAKYLSTNKETQLM